MTQHYYSHAVIQESTAAFRNYTRKQSYLGYLNPVELKVLVNLVKDPKYERMKVINLQSIKNIVRFSDHERYLRQLGASDVIAQANVLTAPQGGLKLSLDKDR